MCVAVFRTSTLFVCVLFIFQSFGMPAVCVLKGDGISGIVKFSEVDDGVRVVINVNGLQPGKHGFHVHEFGDLSNGCVSAGPHFNPLMKNHGAPNATERHVGDLGNLEADSCGMATLTLVDKQIALSGNHSIIGRAMVIHADPDDLGLGGHELSLTTGNSGARVACGVIGIASQP